MFERLKEIDIDLDLINTIKWLYRQTKIKVGNKECCVT